MKKLFLIILFLYSSLAFSQQIDYLRGKSGHLAANVYIGSHIFTYNRVDDSKPVYYVNEHTDLFYYKSNDIVFNLGLSFFASERHIYNFSFGNYFLVYPEAEVGDVEFGITDSRFLFDNFVIHNGAFALFKGNYEFVYKFGCSFFFELGKFYYLGLRPQININLNHSSIEFLALFEYLYVF